MNHQSTEVTGKYGRRRLAGADWGAGMAKNQLILTIVCAAATALAAVALLTFLMSSGAKPILPTWQCVKCDYEFSFETPVFPPVDCPKCSGQAARVSYQKCPHCGKQVPMYRTRVAEHVRDEIMAMKKQLEEELKDQDPEAGGAINPLVMRMMMAPPKELQFWVKQDDGQYGWGPWLDNDAPETWQLFETLRCSKCGGQLSQRSPEGG